MNSQPRGAAVVEAPARLHLGFIDLHGGLGRRFGSLGLALDQPLIRVRLAAGEADLASGPQASRAAAHLRALREAFAVRVPLELTVESAIPSHAGLGSGTQLALAVAAAFARLAEVALEPVQAAVLLARGARSGAGIGAFCDGGLTLDGGRGAQTAVPPVLARLPFPAGWRVILVLDPARSGLHGAAEREAFEALPEFPEELAAHLARLTLMQILPAAAEADIAAFGAGVGALQAAIGEHFAPAQGGRYMSPAVACCLDWLAREGAACVGQSSWGPTGFAVVDSARRAAQLARLAPRPEGIEVAVACGRNRGARVFPETTCYREARHG